MNILGEKDKWEFIQISAIDPLHLKAGNVRIDFISVYECTDEEMNVETLIKIDVH